MIIPSANLNRSSTSSLFGCFYGVSALNSTAKPKSPAVWACVGVDPLDMPKPPYRAREGKRSQ